MPRLLFAGILFLSALSLTAAKPKKRRGHSTVSPSDEAQEEAFPLDTDVVIIGGGPQALMAMRYYVETGHRAVAITNSHIGAGQYANSYGNWATGFMPQNKVDATNSKGLGDWLQRYDLETFSQDHYIARDKENDNEATQSIWKSLDVPFEKVAKEDLPPEMSQGLLEHLPDLEFFKGQGRVVPRQSFTHQMMLSMYKHFIYGNITSGSFTLNMETEKSQLQTVRVKLPSGEVLHVRGKAFVFAAGTGNRALLELLAENIADEDLREDFVEAASALHIAQQYHAVRIVGDRSILPQVRLNLLHWELKTEVSLTTSGGELLEDGRHVPAILVETATKWSRAQYPVAKELTNGGTVAPRRNEVIACTKAFFDVLPALWPVRHQFEYGGTGGWRLVNPQKNAPSTSPFADLFSHCTNCVLALPGSVQNAILNVGAIDEIIRSFTQLEPSEAEYTPPYGDKGIHVADIHLHDERLDWYAFMAKYDFKEEEVGPGLLIPHDRHNPDHTDPGWERPPENRGDTTVPENHQDGRLGGTQPPVHDEL